MLHDSDVKRIALLASEIARALSSVRERLDATPAPAAPAATPTGAVPAGGPSPTAKGQVRTALVEAVSTFVAVLFRVIRRLPVDGPTGVRARVEHHALAALDAAGRERPADVVQHLRQIHNAITEANSGVPLARRREIEVALDVVLQTLARPSSGRSDAA